LNFTRGYGWGAHEKGCLSDHQVQLFIDMKKKIVD